jgi:hypothetical protein
MLRPRFQNEPVEDLGGGQLVTEAGGPEAYTVSERATSTQSPFPVSSESAPFGITKITT